MGSTYTTASESGGPPTIESEPGNYLSASEDHPRMPEVNVTLNQTASGLSNTASDLTVIPQHTYDPMARVSLQNRPS